MYARYASNQEAVIYLFLESRVNSRIIPTRHGMVRVYSGHPVFLVFFFFFSFFCLFYPAIVSLSRLSAPAVVQ